MSYRHRIQSYFLVAILFSIIVGEGCKNFVKDDRISEGIIVFDVTYPKLKENSVLKDFLPTKMTLKFRDDKFHSELSAAFGLFKTNVVSFGDGEHFAQTVKLIDKKYAVEYDKPMAEASNALLPPISIQHTGNQKEIAGYTCKEAIVTVDNAEKEVYKIYYTEEINIDQANWFTQFNSIPGVLMEYQIEKYNVCTRFTALTVESTEVDGEIFAIEDDYEMISEERLNSEMMDIFDEFSDE